MPNRDNLTYTRGNMTHFVEPSDTILNVSTNGTGIESWNTLWDDYRSPQTDLVTKKLKQVRFG